MRKAFAKLLLKALEMVSQDEEHILLSTMESKLSDQQTAVGGTASVEAVVLKDHVQYRAISSRFIKRLCSLPIACAVSVSG